MKNIDITKGFDKSNNGYPLHSQEVDRLISVVPTENQLLFSDIGYYSFIHYGMNTFTGKEWGTGKESPSEFNPTGIDTDQWVRVLKESGSKAIIFTAKHHDGFCLFQTRYTEHSIKNSPYQNGQGDVVRQLAQSCRKYGMMLGIYLSPWDRNSSLYGKEEYNDYFANQLTELCTNYGDIFCFWFDGAKGKEAPDFEYDWQRYFDVIKKYQPNAIIANCGPDVRWIGNEAGKTRHAEWSVVPAELCSTQQTMNKSQQSEGDAKRLSHASPMDDDLGSRETVSSYDKLIWYPAEADVSIHYDWFYNKKSRKRSAKLLEKIYYSSVGGNASMLLNVPPSKRGIIEPKDVRILQKFAMRIQNKFASPIEFTAMVGTQDITSSVNSPNGSHMLTDGQSTVTIKTESIQKISAIVLTEDISHSQRIEAFELYAKKKNNYECVFVGTVVGSKRIICLKKPIKTNELKLMVTQSRSYPFLRQIDLYS